MPSGNESMPGLLSFSLGLPCPFSFVWQNLRPGRLRYLSVSALDMAQVFSWEEREQRAQLERSAFEQD